MYTAGAAGNSFKGWDAAALALSVVSNHRSALSGCYFRCGGSLVRRARPGARLTNNPADSRRAPSNGFPGRRVRWLLWRSSARGHSREKTAPRLLGNFCASPPTNTHTHTSLEFARFAAAETRLTGTLAIGEKEREGRHFQRGELGAEGEG